MKELNDNHSTTIDKVSETVGTIQWYASDKRDTSIIAYGFFTKDPQPHDNKKGDTFKIIYRKGIYLAYKKVHRKYKFIQKERSVQALISLVH